MSTPENTTTTAEPPPTGVDGLGNILESAARESIATTTNPNAAEGAVTGNEGEGGGNNGGTENQEKSTQPDIESLMTARFSELSGGKAKSFDELRQIAAEEAKATLNPLASKLNAFLSGGESDLKTFTRLATISNTDVSKLSDSEAIRMKIELDNPTEDAEWVQREFNSRFAESPRIKHLETRLAKQKENEDEAGMEDTRVEIELLKQEEARKAHAMGKEAKTARSDIEKFKSEIKWESNEDRHKAAQAQHEANRSLFAKSVLEAAPKISSITVPITIGDSTEQFTYEIGDAGREALTQAAEKAASSFDNPLSRWVKEGSDGKPYFDTKAYVEDMFFLENRGRIMSAAADRYKSGGVASVVNPMVNATLPEGGGVAKNLKEKTPAQLHDEAADRLVNSM